MNNAELLLFTLTRFRKGLIKMQCWATLNNAVQRIYSEIKLLAQIEFEMSKECLNTINYLISHKTVTGCFQGFEELQ